MKNYQAFLLRTTYSIAIMAILWNNPSYGQLVDIVANPSQGGNDPIGASYYHAAENIYTEAEIGADNFTTAATVINQIAFNVYQVGAPTSFTNVTVWIKEVPLSTATFTSGTYSTDGYTQVFNGTLNILSVGWLNIPLSTNFQRTSGNNLQVLIERRDNVAHPGYMYKSANGNNTSAIITTSRRYNNATALSAATSLSASAFRAQIRLQHVYPNDAFVQQIYTLGKLPIPFSNPHVIKANIANTGANTLTNLPVTLTITGANPFTDVQTIASLAPGANTDVTFGDFSPTAQGNNNISVSIPDDDFSGNNSKSVTQSVNNNTFSYAYGTVPDGGAGVILAPFTGDFVAKYHSAVSTAISQVSVYFITGGQPFQIGIWDATGAGGTPGNLLFTSATQTSKTGVYVMPILPAIPVNGDFFVGARQIDVNNILFAFQTEDPVRANTFYLTQPTGGTTWTDLAPAYKNRFMIEPKLQIPIDANLTSIITPTAACQTGAVSYSVLLSNVGLNTISAGAANVTLRVGGANVYTATLSNTTDIASGTSESIHFNGIDLSNPGANIDTAFVTLSGDTEPLNDTLTTTNNSTPATVINTFPAVENAEASLPLFSNFSPVEGSSQLWLLNSGNYTNADQTSPLAPHGGSKFYLFNSYGGPNSAGFISRLYSNCIAIPAGSGSSCNYTLRFYMSHDNISARSQSDSLYVTVSPDNGVTWTRLLPGFQRFNAAYTTPGWEKLEQDLSAYAGQTIQVGFEGVSGYGNAFGLDDISIASAPVQGLVLSPATNNGIALTKQCDDQGWTYYSNPATPSTALFAVNWDPSNTGANVAAKAAGVPTIQLDDTYYAAQDIPAKKATYTMKRYWNVNTGASTLTGPVNVRFFYDSTERRTVDSAAAAFANTNAGTLETPLWFKTVGSAFIGNARHVNQEGVITAIELKDVNTANNTINGVAYAEFDSITSFSGGTYATGVGPGNPLPVTLVSFDVKRTGKINQVSWSTSLELNTSKFIIERGTDGRHFSPIGEVKTTGGSNIVRYYTFSDNAPVRGINYYRLRVVDIDNSGKYSTIRSVRNEGSVDIAIYPNPVKTVFSVKINADKADKGDMVITDVSGKVVLTKSLVLAAGLNLVPLNVNSIAAGSYVMKITLSDDVVTRKFDKQ